MSNRLKRIDDWLLALLKFAITRDTTDRTAAIELARQMDAGETGATASITYFVRTTVEVCQAIAWGNNRRRVPVLRRHFARIENPRLRKAFGAAIGLEESDASRSSQASSREYLWKGLSPSPATKS
jgi:hypothetical protein